MQKTSCRRWVHKLTGRISLRLLTVQRNLSTETVATTMRNCIRAYCKFFKCFWLSFSRMPFTENIFRYWKHSIHEIYLYVVTATFSAWTGYIAFSSNKSALEPLDSHIPQYPWCAKCFRYHMTPFFQKAEPSLFTENNQVPCFKKLVSCNIEKAISCCGGRIDSATMTSCNKTYVGCTGYT